MMHALLQKQQMMIDQSLISHVGDLKDMFHRSLMSYKDVILKLKASTILSLPDSEILRTKQVREGRLWIIPGRQ